MATSREAEALTASYIAQQRANAAAAALLVQRYWAAVRWSDIDGTSAVWLRAILPFLFQARERAGRFAMAYANGFRRLELREDAPAGGRLYEARPLTAGEREAIETSMRVTGPIKLKQSITALTQDSATPAELDRLTAAAGKTAGNAAIRQVANGGRTVIDEGVRRDAKALGWIRVARPDCCYFCAMLASRGPVYKAADTFAMSNESFEGPGEFKVHDHCFCDYEPVYSRQTRWPEVSSRMDNLWKELSRKLGRAPTLKEWREFYGSLDN